MRALATLLGFIAIWVSPVLAQEPIDVLVVDETESLTESLAVNIIIGLVRQEVDVFSSVDAVIAKVKSPFDLPFHAKPNGKDYDMVIVAPKGVMELGEIYLVTEAYPQTCEKLKRAMTFLETLGKDLNDQFNLNIQIKDVNTSFFAGLLSTYFYHLGLLRPHTGSL